VSDNESVRLVGDGVVISAHASRAEGLERVAKKLGMRRLLPVGARELPPWGRPDASETVTVACMACGRSSPCTEMLADPDGPPYKAYYHPGCIGCK